MKRIIGIALIVLGLVLVVQGVNREDSLAGAADEAGARIANTVDGGSRVPDHLGYMIGGGVLIAIGAVLTFRGGRRALP